MIDWGGVLEFAADFYFGAVAPVILIVFILIEIHSGKEF